MEPLIVCEKSGWPVDLPENWRDVLPPAPAHFAQRLQAGLANVGEDEVWPRRRNWFAAFEQTPPESVRVLIFGQDPYHGPNQAHGLAFSVPSGVRIPPSLRNIFQELREDVGGGAPGFGRAGVLDGWAEQGVLLLNRVLTVSEGQAGSHGGWGWELLTDAVVEWAADQERPMVAVLWGKWAESLAASFHHPLHQVLVSAHPSPLSAYRGFKGSRPFSRANEWLTLHGGSPIDWSR